MVLEHDAVVTPSTPGDVAAAFVGAWWGRFRTRPKAANIAMLLAQWALETGHGKGMWNYNIGNIKGREGDGKDYTFFKCNELLTPATAKRLVALAKPRTDGVEGLDAVITGESGALLVVWFYPSNPACRFRAYDTLAQGAADYLGLLFARFQKAWPYILSGDPHGYAVALKAQGYYTAPTEQYASGITSLFKKYLATMAYVNLDEPEAVPEPSWHELTEEDRARTIALSSATLFALTTAGIDESFGRTVLAEDEDEEPTS